MLGRMVWDCITAPRSRKTASLPRTKSEQRLRFGRAEQRGVIRQLILDDRRRIVIGHQHTRRDRHERVRSGHEARHVPCYLRGQG